ncbi:hypothetical protein N0V88_001849 [Collariella sp. IMI 366227]|nr:hypothetical protein N0V88_001849 [Collariella sp. IMI 366227]
MSDLGSLTDSSYEFVQNTDTESHDGGLSESTGSLSISRPEDVHSLDGSESQYRTESDDEADHSSRASSIRYADQTLQSPSTQLPTNMLEHGSSTEGSGVVVRSIAFQEGDGNDEVLPENIAAMHAIQEFDEKDSLALAQQLNVVPPPNRLVATIRQTMSPAYLSTKEPLRVLFVGRADAQRSIVLKVCNAIWASPKTGSDDQDHFSRYRDGVYNIVPISSFGPNPELDLLEASHYQIKVEHCTSAEHTILGPRSRKDEPLTSITIDQEKTYDSFMDGITPTVEPKWDLPHIAIFYCTDQDDEETREARHGLPSIFIADQPTFSDKSGVGARPWNLPWSEYIDEHSPHLCIESRDPKRLMYPRRFPIDYASFADIDARQMNRNLAYLTGLFDTDEIPLGKEVETETQDLESAVKSRTALESTKQTFANLVKHHGVRKLLSTLLLPILLSMMVPFLVAFLAGWLPSGIHSNSTTSLDGVCVPPPKHPQGFTTKPTSVATSTTTVVINVTSTKTVQVSQAKPSTSTLASALSFAGFLSDKPSAAATEPEVKKPANSTKKTICLVRVHSPTKFLVTVPRWNRAMWYPQGTIDINVHRSDEFIKTKISSLDDGFLDAHGILNVSVTMTRTPKINETFQLDFGKSVFSEAFDAGLHMLHDAAKKFSSSVDDASHYLDDTMKLRRKEAAAALENFSKDIRDGATGAAKRATDNVREHVARHLETAETVRKEADLVVLQAQITSRLWWLKMQGRMEEYKEYERNASRFLKVKRDELLKAGGKHKERGGRQQMGGRFYGWKRPSFLGDTGERLKCEEGKTGKEGRKNSLWKGRFGV